MDFIFDQLKPQISEKAKNSIHDMFIYQNLTSKHEELQQFEYLDPSNPKITEELQNTFHKKEKNIEDSCQKQEKKEMINQILKSKHRQLSVVKSDKTNPDGSLFSNNLKQFFEIMDSDFMTLVKDSVELDFHQKYKIQLKSIDKQVFNEESLFKDIDSLIYESHFFPCYNCHELFELRSGKLSFENFYLVISLQGMEINHKQKLAQNLLKLTIMELFEMNQAMQKSFEQLYNSSTEVINACIQVINWKEFYDSISANNVPLNLQKCAYIFFLNFKIQQQPITQISEFNENCWNEIKEPSKDLQQFLQKVVNKEHTFGSFNEIKELNKRFLQSYELSLENEENKGHNSRFFAFLIQSLNSYAILKNAMFFTQKQEDWILEKLHIENNKKNIEQEIKKYQNYLKEINDIITENNIGVPDIPLQFLNNIPYIVKKTVENFNEQNSPVEINQSDINQDQTNEDQFFEEEVKLDSQTQQKKKEKEKKEDPIETKQYFTKQQFDFEVFQRIYELKEEIEQNDQKVEIFEGIESYMRSICGNKTEIDYKKEPDCVHKDGEYQTDVYIDLDSKFCILYEAFTGRREALIKKMESLGDYYEWDTKKREEFMESKKRRNSATKNQEIKKKQRRNSDSD